MRCRRCGSSTARKPKPCGTVAEAAGKDTGELDELITELDQEIARSGLRGKADPSRPRPRRHRSTRRRQDAPDLPQAQNQPPHHRQDLHRTGRQDLPALDVPHPHLPWLRPRQ